MRGFGQRNLSINNVLDVVMLVMIVCDLKTGLCELIETSDLDAWFCEKLVQETG